MYEAIFYTPDDHAHFSSEEYLEVYRSKQIESGRVIKLNDSALRSCLFNLELHDELPQSAEQHRQIVKALEERNISPGAKGVLYPV